MVIKRIFLLDYTEVHFASFFSGGFITAIVVNPPEKKLAKRTSVAVARAVGHKLLFTHLDIRQPLKATQLYR